MLNKGRDVLFWSKKPLNWVLNNFLSFKIHLAFYIFFLKKDFIFLNININFNLYLSPNEKLSFSLMPFRTVAPGF